MATDTTQKKINVLSPDSRGFILWNQVTIENVTADDKTELFDVPENCRLVGLAARVVTVDSGTALEVMVEADDNSGPTALGDANLNMKTANDVMVILPAATGLLLVPQSGEKHVTIQIDVASVTAGGGDGVVFAALELIRVDYDRS